MKHLILIFSISCLPFLSFAASSEPTNFSIINEALSRGGSPAGEAKMIFLQEIGVRTVVNLQGGDLGLLMFPSENRSGIKKEKRLASQLGMNFIHQPVPAAGIMSSQYKSKIRKLIAKMRRPENQPIYVHCLIGNDRTSLIVALFRYCSEQSNVSMRSGYYGLTTLFTGGLDLFYREATSTPGWCLPPN